MPPPVNDQLANATLITTFPVTLSGTTVDSTATDGEMAEGWSDTGVWYRAEVPVDGTLTFAIAGATFNYYAEVFEPTDTTPSNYNDVIDGDYSSMVGDIGTGDGSDDETDPIAALAGDVYYIHVTDYDVADNEGTFSFVASLPEAQTATAQGVWIAGTDGLFAEPITDPQRLDETYNVQQITIRRGRQDEFADVPPGTCEISFVDTGGTFDPEPFDSKQAGVSIRNPVTDTWHDLFRGMLDETVIDISPTQVKRDVTLQLVDWLDYFAKCEMHPAPSGTPYFGDPPPAGSERMVFFESLPVNDRIAQVLDNLNFPDDLATIFSGNIQVLDHVYSPGESALTVIDECCEAEFPGVAIRFVSKSGEFIFHGRLARFRPDVAQYDIGDWECGDGVAVHASSFTRAQIRPPLTGRRASDRVINRAHIYPRKDENHQPFTDAQIASVVVQNTTSQNAHGIQSYTVPDLDIRSSFLSSLTGLEECEMYAQHFVDQFADPQTRVQQLTFKSLHPDDPRAPAIWDLICRVEISDRINLLVSGDHGQELSGDYFVEGISYDIRPLEKTLDLGYPMVEMTLDVSPRLYWQNDPWEAFT